MAEYTKFGVREIANVVFKAAADGTKFCGNTYAKGQPILYFDSLKTSTVEGAGTTVYADGGRGNTHLVSWTGEKTITFTMEDALISPLSLAALASAKVETGTKTVHKTEFITAPDGGSVTVNGIKANSTLYYAEVDDENNLKAVPTKVSHTSGTTETLSLTAGKAYYIDYYSEVTNTTVISLTGDDLGINFYVEAETLFRGQDGLDRPAEFIIPKAKIQSNFTFSMAATGDPSTFSFTMDAFPGKTENSGNKKVLCEINVLDSIYDPDDGIEDTIKLNITEVTDGPTIVEVINKDAGLTYKYKSASSISTPATVGKDQSTVISGYSAVTFDSSIPNIFVYTPGSSDAYIQVIGVRGNDIEAVSVVTAL